MVFGNYIFFFPQFFFLFFFMCGWWFPFIKDVGGNLYTNIQRERNNTVNSRYSASKFFDFFSIHRQHLNTIQRPDQKINKGKRKAHGLHPTTPARTIQAVRGSFLQGRRSVGEVRARVTVVLSWQYYSLFVIAPDWQCTCQYDQFQAVSWTRFGGALVSCAVSAHLCILYAFLSFHGCCLTWCDILLPRPFKFSLLISLWVILFYVFTLSPLVSCQLFFVVILIRGPNFVCCSPLWFLSRITCVIYKFEDPLGF